MKNGLVIMGSASRMIDKRYCANRLPGGTGGSEGCAMPYYAIWGDPVSLAEQTGEKKEI